MHRSDAGTREGEAAVEGEEEGCLLQFCPIFRLFWDERRIFLFRQIIIREGGIRIEKKNLWNLCGIREKFGNAIDWT